jgi:sugar lactone lactonase YvrE
MKRYSGTALVLSLTTLLLASPGMGETLLNQPESVVFDAERNRYLVSNWGDGSIVVIGAGYEESYFSTELSRICGLHILDNTLYVASNQEPHVGVVGFDLETSAMVVDIPLPEAVLPNGLATDGEGSLYVTDYWDTKIFKVDLATRTYSILAVEGLDDPNGIVYDQFADRLLTTSHVLPGYPIHAVDRMSGTVTVAMEPGIPSLDGIVQDDLGFVYVSSWHTDAIYRLDPSGGGPPELFSTGHADPADIYIDRHNGLLCIPNFGSDTIDYVPLGSVPVQSTTWGRIKAMRN